MLEFLSDVTVPVPMIQIIMLMLISTVSLLFGKLKLALMMNYIFTLHWAYVANRDSLMDLGFEKFEMVTSLYYLFGIGIILVAAFAFLFQKKD